MRIFKENGLTIEKTLKKEITPEFINDRYKHLKDPSVPVGVFERTLKENTSGEVIGMIISGENAISTVRKLIGPGDVKKAKMEFPNCIRAMGNENNNPDNLIHASDSSEHAEEDIQLFFEFDPKEYLKPKEIILRRK